MCTCAGVAGSLPAAGAHCFPSPWRPYYYYDYYYGMLVRRYDGCVRGFIVWFIV